MAITKNVPRDGSFAPLQLTFPQLALKVTTPSSTATSTGVTLQTGTQLIEVNALAQGLYMKWGTGATATIFDEYIQAGYTRHYIVPTGQTSVQFLAQASGATLILIEK